MRPHVPAVLIRPAVRLIDAGLSRSTTFRSPVVMLNESDVIVYIEPKLTREALGGYLQHRVVVGGQYRYLRVAVEIAGSERHLVSLLAHELQHALEIAQAPEARDAERHLLTPIRRLAAARQRTVASHPAGSDWRNEGP